MSQSNVERVIGVLATDEALRRRFLEEPRTTLLELAARGMHLTACELQALASMNCRLLARFANGIDPRLQKTDLSGNAEPSVDRKPEVS